MSSNWQRIHVPFVERAVLLELSERWGVDEEEALRRILRDAAIRELITPQTGASLTGQGISVHA